MVGSNVLQNELASLNHGAKYRKFLPSPAQHSDHTIQADWDNKLIRKKCSVNVFSYL